MAERAKVSPAPPHIYQDPYSRPRQDPRPPHSWGSQGTGPGMPIPSLPPSLSHSPGNQNRRIKEKDLAAVQGETNGPEGRRRGWREEAVGMGACAWALALLRGQTHKEGRLLCPAMLRELAAREPPSSPPQPDSPPGAPNLPPRCPALVLRVNPRQTCLPESPGVPTAAAPWLLANAEGLSILAPVDPASCPCPLPAARACD